MRWKWSASGKSISIRWPMIARNIRNRSISTFRTKTISWRPLMTPPLSPTPFSTSTFGSPTKMTLSYSCRWLPWKTNNSTWPKKSIWIPHNNMKNCNSQDSKASKRPSPHQPKPTSSKCYKKCKCSLASTKPISRSERPSISGPSIKSITSTTASPKTYPSHKFNSTLKTNTMTSPKALWPLSGRAVSNYPKSALKKRLKLCNQ